MNRIFIVTLLFIIFYRPVFVLAAISNRTSEMDVISFLNKMSKAVESKDYKLLFIRSTGEDLGTAFEYRHTSIAGKQFAKLVYLEGTVKKILQRGNFVSYYQPDHHPFSINSNQIIEVFPEVIFNDFSQLNRYYNFIPIGQARVADHSAQLIRITPKYNDRYNYVIWISKDLFIPLRIDLYNPQFRLLEQFKVVLLAPLTEHASLLNEINKTKLPLVLSTSNRETSLSNQWRTTWLPPGFTERAGSQIDYEKNNIDTRLYSDGVFSFTINVSKNPAMKKTRSLQSGHHIVYVTYVLDREITIIGDLPIDTIKKIAKQIKIEA